MFGLDGQTLISIGIQLFNTCLFAALLSFILYRPVRDYMARRREGIKAQLERTEADLNDVALQKALYEQKLKEIEAERAYILDSAHKIAAESSRHMLDEAKKGADAMLSRARAEISRERERANEEMRLQIIEVSSVMAGRFVSEVMDDETAERLFVEAMAELEEMAWLS